MTDVESSLFGAPTSLLGELDTISDDSNQATTTSQTTSETFLLASGLLGGPGDNGVNRDSFGDATLLNTAQETSDAFGAPSLLAEGLPSFSYNGLLPEATRPTRPSGQPQTQSQDSFSFGSATLLSQSQDDEFPPVKDILRPFAKTNTSVTNIGASSSTSFLQYERASIRATTLSGKSVLLKRKSKKIDLPSHVKQNQQKMGNLLEVPMHRLLDELSLQTASKLAEEDLNRPPTSTVVHTKESATLWVDRYKPQRFTELIGDDRVHREVMAWVKGWDYCVFGKGKGKSVKRSRTYMEGDSENQDERMRPTEKILLISGPPGLGKTTLAHVVAKHAGYSVFEVNASDARSASVVDERIRPALESGSAVGSTKPVLVVIDEIDGATGGTDNSGGFIYKLIQLTQDRPRKKSRNKSNGNPESSRPLLRPIICICNDLYSSSLTKLRQIAKIIRFQRPNDLHIVKRLKGICELEGMKFEGRALSTLVGVCGGDLRGCLNTLQLVKTKISSSSKSNQTITESIIRKATSGMKEAESTQATVLNDLFIPMSKKRVKDLGLTEDDEAKYVTRLSRDIDACGGIDKVAIGCFEHYATLRKYDSTFSRFLKATEWLSSFDILSGEMRNEREYSLLAYLSYMLVGFYPLFSERGNEKVERPKADWEHFQLTKTNEEIYKSLAKNLRLASSSRHSPSPGAYRHFATEPTLQLEFAPMINRIINPPLRPVNSQVIKPEEKLILKRLVDVMVSLELRFVQDKSEEGQNVYRLDPPIDVFVTYDGKRASDIQVSRYAVRHLVASEIDAQLINRQAEDTTDKKTKPSKSAFFNNNNNKNSNDSSANPTRPNKRTKLDTNSSQIGFEEKIPVDFFGRPIVPKSKSTTSNSKPTSKNMGSRKAEKVKEKVTYKFYEGNSAAVRKPVKVSSFL
ncbi:hypothetical protein ABKN59_003317 [Abortiporus biennis]